MSCSIRFRMAQCRVATRFDHVVEARASSAARIHADKDAEGPRIPHARRVAVTPRSVAPMQPCRSSSQATSGNDCGRVPSRIRPRHTLRIQIPLATTCPCISSNHVALLNQLRVDSFVMSPDSLLPVPKNASALGASILARLSAAGVLILVLWVAVFWALT